MDVPVAAAPEGLQGKAILRALDLLEAEDVGLIAIEKPPTRSIRSRTELMFQVAMETDMSVNRKSEQGIASSEQSPATELFYSLFAIPCSLYPYPPYPQMKAPSSGGSWAPCA